MTLEVIEYLLTPTKTPPQPRNNMDDVYRNLVKAKIMRKEMSKLWSYKEILVQDKRGILIWYHRMKQCTSKNITSLSNKGVITKNTINTRNLPPYVVCLFGKSQKRIWKIKGNKTRGKTRKSQ